ncbi:MAG TPA: valine--tRNA ligase [Acidobacteriaceae bacterium]|nr:valine--tRNA ligase [Acidobacteriaceae bacterium]
MPQSIHTDSETEKTAAPRELPKAYDPAAIEERWAQYWVRERLFDVATPQPGSGTPPAFTVLLPPPNVTGNLHMGHMFEHTETDILVRWRRMLGQPTVWVPGTDHAGIATQMLVERQLTSEGTSRQKLGREAFVKRVWEWREHYGGSILASMKRIGDTVDWSREYFTMDENLSHAVREAFVRLYEQGLIYRGAYIVNWCPRCQTAISDLEVAHEEQQGKLWQIRYPVIDAPGEFLSVATTRPETMLGDTAVAVNPRDERYKHLHGRRLRLPLVGRDIPVVLDEWVKSDFGTGAVKVTPAHDPNDFAIAQRHHLPAIAVMDETAHMNAEAGQYQGLDRYEARKRVLEDLEAQGLLGAVRDHVNAIGKCDRCKTVVEPRLSTQWFVAVNKPAKEGGPTMASLAIAAVVPNANGHKPLRFTPENNEKIYLEWMNNIYDWCISRQLWWGHRIPAWHCGECHKLTVARQDPTHCGHCGSKEITQETDVLDTWFSSGLLPVTVFGWPPADGKPTADLAAFYPTSLLVTGFDILFFWVARMIMLGCWFMQDIPLPDGSPRPIDEIVPFREVYIHALVRDADRQKMSKTKGNVIDPVEIVNRYGTDAVRFTLASMASPGTDIAFNEARTEGYRAFANKIWNAARFIFMNVERGREAGIEVDPAELGAMPTAADDAPLEMRWIASRTNSVAAEINAALGEYRFHEAANLVYQFFWGDFCDWYLEIVKLRLDFSEGANKAATKTALTLLLQTFESALRLLSPFMPFLTEELWHALYDGNPPAKSIALMRYPQGAAHSDDPAESDFALLQELIVSVRALRKDLGVEEKASVPILIKPLAPGLPFAENLEIIQRLARVSGVETVDRLADGKPVRATPQFDVQVQYEKKVDVAAERDRLSKELARYEKEQANANRQLGNEAFLGKAPAAVVEGLRRRAAELTMLIEKTQKALEDLK